MDIDDAEFENHKKTFLETLGANIDKIEIETRNQNDSIKWQSERLKRLTASNFGRICKLRKNTSRANVVKLLLYSNFKGNDATRYGHEMEKTAREDIGNKLNIAIDECGLFISPD